MRHYVFLLALLISLLPRVAGAQEPKPIEIIPPGDDIIVTLPKGVVAPYDGQLFENNTALRWANWLRQYKLRLNVDVQEQKDVCTIRTTSLQQQLLVEQQKYLKVTGAYESRITQLQYEKDNPPWYKTPTFYIGTGVVGTALVVVGSVLIVHAAQSN